MAFVRGAPLLGAGEEQGRGEEEGEVSQWSEAVGRSSESTLLMFCYVN